MRTLDPLDKLIALYIFTAQSNRIGIFNFSPAEAEEDMQTRPPTRPPTPVPQRFFERLRHVVSTLNLGWDNDKRVLYLPTWWRYNRPDNPHHLQACLNDLDELPQTPLIIEFLTNYRYLPDTFAEKLRERKETYPYTCPHTSPPLELELEQEQEQEKSNANAAHSRRRSTQSDDKMPDEFKRFWNLYPLKAGRKAAAKAWTKLSPSPDLVQTILAALEKHKLSRQWEKNNGEFIPHASTWLNGARWTDDLPPAAEADDGPMRPDEEFEPL